MTKQLTDANAPKKAARFHSSPLKKFGLSDQLKALSAIREAAYRGNWTTLRSLGFDCLGKAYAGIQALCIEHSQSFSVKNRKVETHGVYRSLQRLLKNERYEDITDRFKKRWSTSNPDLLKRVLDSLETVKRGDRTIPLIISEKNFSEIIKEKYPVKDSLEKSLISMAHRGLLAISRSYYQLAFSSLKNQQQTKDTLKQKMQLLLNETNSFENQLRNCQRDIFHALGKGDPISSLPTIYALISFVETKLPHFTSIQAQAFKEMQNLYNSDRQYNQLEKLGQLTARAGSIAREVLASHAAAYRIIVDLHKDKLTLEAKKLLNNADMKAFDAKMPNGKNVKFADIASIPEDKLIELSGIVQAVDSTRDKSGKLIGRAILLELASGHKVQIAFPYAHFSHMGLTVNSYCIVNGYYKNSSKIMSGEAGVEIQKFSLKELADKAWRFAFIKYADDWYQCWRNQANMMFSLGPHIIIGEDYAQKGAQGAGELIYPPYYRL